jgi:hypothetical protein
MKLKIPFGRSAEVIRAEAEQERLNRMHGVKASAEELKLEDLRYRQTRDRQLAERAQAQQDRAERSKRLVGLARTVGLRLLISFPIVAPMTVAWIGQIGFAAQVLGWSLLGALVFAASWEATTAFCGWMYHQARKIGDKGTSYRIATWVFAAAAGTMNYWHSCPTVVVDGVERVSLDPTAKAVSYGVMSLTGIALWELYASLIHKKELRAKKLLPPPRPRFGVARWVRYPAITFSAWSLSILAGAVDGDQAWSLALEKRGLAGRTNRTVKIFGRVVFEVKAWEVADVNALLAAVLPPERPVILAGSVAKTEEDSRQNDRQNEVSGDGSAARTDRQNEVSVAKTSRQNELSGDGSGDKTETGDRQNDRQNATSGGELAAGSGGVLAAGDEVLAATSGGRKPRQATAARKAATPEGKAPNREMSEWVALTAPLYVDHLKVTGQAPTGPQFAELIQKAGLGAVSVSRAKLIRSEITDVQIEELEESYNSSSS